ncbi:MAG: TrkH family potassium uptake protein [Nodosilinea sp.]
MSIQLRAISRDLSRFLLIPAGMALCSLPVAIIAQEWFTIIPFLATLLGAGGFSLILQRLSQNASDSSLRQILICVALGWGIVSAMGALPLWLTALMLGADAPPVIETFRNPLNAVFEGFSGFTSAGLTMVIRPSELPASLQWWRSFMQWIGGVGVVVLAIALMEPSQEQYVLYEAEGRQSQLRLTITRTVRRIWVIYTGYTVLGLFLFRIFGMTWWEALNHSMTAIATGGFSITDGSMNAYSAPLKLAIMVIMICGAVSFSMHDQLLLRRRLSALWRDRQHFLLLFLLVVGSGIVAIDHYTYTGRFAWVDSAFQWVSALTTCGFSTESIQFRSSSNKILLSIAMVLGAAAGSTVGGIKLDRVLALIESIAWRFRRSGISPRETTLRWINGQPLKPDAASRQIEDAVALALLWLLSVIVGMFILMRFVPAEYDLSDVIFEVTSALGAAGLSVGITGPSLHWVGKSSIIALMWMGRLEIVPALMLLYAPWRYLLKAARS